jgi:hypothetical protein
MLAEDAPVPMAPMAPGRRATIDGSQPIEPHEEMS